MEEQENIIVADALGVIKTDIDKEYLAHLLCLGGTAVTVSMNGISSCMRGICPLSANGS